VLVVDLDPQGSTTQWLDAQAARRGVYELLTDDAAIGEIVSPTAVRNVQLVAATPALQGVERALAREMGAEMILRRKLQELDGPAIDYVLIDTPPTLGLLTLNALAAARELIVPVEAHVMALVGVSQLVSTVKMVRDRLNPDLQLTGIVACRVDSRTRHAADVVESLRGTFENKVYQTEIRENVRLAEAPSFKRPIMDYDTRSTGAADYRALAKEVAAQEGTG